MPSKSTLQNFDNYSSEDMGIRRDANCLENMPYGLSTKKKNRNNLRDMMKVPSRIILNCAESQKNVISNRLPGKNEQIFGRVDHA